MKNNAIHKRIPLGLFLMAFSTLMSELTLIRVFDVLWYPNMAFMIITLAMFSFGLAGVYSSLKPLNSKSDIRSYISMLSFFYGIFILAILPIMNIAPFIKFLYSSPISGIFSFILMYLLLGIPFFLSGLIFTSLFSNYANKIQSLYFYDLTGAALGCIFLIPFLPKIGPGGLLFITCALGFLASALFSRNRMWSLFMAAFAVIIIAFPFFKIEGYYDFKEHLSKRGVKTDKIEGKGEISYWDPISKIDVVKQKERTKHIAYDGGTQSSIIYQFDGDFAKLRKGLPRDTPYHFGGTNVLISHFLKRDSNQNVLVIGSAGGQEIKGALTYGAKHVDAIELVEFVVRLGKETYSDFNGNIFNHPDVNSVVGEGRSYLRSSTQKYDIIQIFSNHSSSSIAGGAGAMATNYLQTAEAYQEYFTHLKPDGILHVNHHIYPRLVTTSALAWKKLGKENFQKHVVVCEAFGKVQDNLPTLLIKMSPWTKKELLEIQKFIGIIPFKIVVNPFRPEKSFLSSSFFSGEIPAELSDQIPFRITPATDNQPYLNFIRKKVTKITEDDDVYLNYSIASLLNNQLKDSFIQYVPKDVLPLVVIGAASLFFTGLFIFIPLYFSTAGKLKWYRKKSALSYFSCLGAGFIILELVFIQIFIKLIGYPLYTYSTVVFTLLFSAALGSYSSKKLKIGLSKRWYFPFIGIIGTGILLILLHSFVFNFFLMSPKMIRILVASLMIFPLGFFLGMPFPLGILAIEKQPEGAIAWAWGLNGLFTIIGGILSVLLSIYLGFKETIILVLLIYSIAFYMFSRIRNSRSEDIKQ